MEPSYISDVLRVNPAWGRALASCSGGISAREVDLLAEIVGELRPSHSLEVGLGYGISALAICDALPASSRHIVIDPHQHTHWKGGGLHNLQRAGHGDRIDFYEETSFRVLPRLEAEGVQVDFAFVDGWHTFDHVLVDFFYIDKMLHQGGVVAFDDADWPSVRRVLRFIVANLPYRVYRTLPVERGERSRQRRAYELFLDAGGFVLRGLSRMPGLRKPISRAFGAELLGVDRDLGLSGSCIALQKCGNDQRWVDHFEVF